VGYVLCVIDLRPVICKSLSFVVIQCSLASFLVILVSHTRKILCHHCYLLQVMMFSCTRYIFMVLHHGFMLFQLSYRVQEIHVFFIVLNWSFGFLVKLLCNLFRPRMIPVSGKNCQGFSPEIWNSSSFCALNVEAHARCCIVRNFKEERKVL
jgi:hypothetical protein